MPASYLSNEFMQPYVSLLNYIKTRKIIIIDTLLYGHAMVQVVSRRPLTAEVWVHARLKAMRDLFWTK
jgi:hypothetical protein